MHARPDDQPWNIDCHCGARRGFLPGEKSIGAGREHVEYMRGVLAQGWTLPLAGLLICRNCDYGPGRAGSVPREQYMMDIGTPAG